MIFKISTSIFLLSLFVCCTKKVVESPIIIDPIVESKMLVIKGVDASFIPEVRASNIITKNADGVAEDILTTYKKNGVNTIRIKLWKNPANVHASFNEVKSLAQEVKNMGMKVWLTVHYSDTWADPGNQQKPAQWNNISYAQLKDSVYGYTKKIVTEIPTDYIQIGNEINSGLLWPEGNTSNPTQMVELVKQGIKAVRDYSANTKIILHYAGYINAAIFYNYFTNVDYDIIGLSYYPTWHGKNLSALQTNINFISTQFNKPVVIAETSYPFTFGYNDYTNNVVGDASQILTEYAATTVGQAAYLLKIKLMMLDVPRGLGFCYWGADWISMYGPTATNGSSYENQAFWDFNNTALPILKAYNN